MSRKRFAGFEGWPVAFWGAAAVALVTAACFVAHGTEAEGWRRLIRWTARVSGSLFLAVYLAMPLRRLVPNEATAWLLRNRRQVGVSVGLAHAVHGVAIAVFVRLTGHETPVATLVLALLAYAFLAAMVATSFDATARRLGRRRWHRLHATGLHYLWFIFGFTFFGAAMAGDWVSAFFTACFVLALPLRLYGLRGRPAEAPSASLRSNA